MGHINFFQQLVCSLGEAYPEPFVQTSALQGSFAPLPKEISGNYFLAMLYVQSSLDRIEFLKMFFYQLIVIDTHSALGTIMLSALGAVPRFWRGRRTWACSCRSARPGVCCQRYRPLGTGGQVHVRDLVPRDGGCLCLVPLQEFKHVTEDRI